MITLDCVTFQTGVTFQTCVTFYIDRNTTLENLPVHNTASSDKVKVDQCKEYH